MKILLIDNYDSFTYNLYQYLAELTGFLPTVVYNDQLSLHMFREYPYDAVIISPGPGELAPSPIWINPYCGRKQQFLTLKKHPRTENYCPASW